MAQYTEEVRDAVVRMLTKMGVDVTYKRFTNNNIMVRCPFAGVSGHSRGYDSNPSFGIKITDKGFLYNCLTCDRKGRSLIQFGNQLVDENVVKSALDTYTIQNSVALAFPEFYVKDVDNPRKVALTRLKSFDNKSLEFINYNLSRGLDRTDIHTARLRYDKEVQQIIFPAFDADNHLVGTVRKSVVGAWPKFTNDFDTGGHLYLEWLIKGKIGIVVEGMYDALLVYHHLRKLGKLNTYSVVAVYGAKITKVQVKLMVKYFDSIAIMGDHDEAGIMMEQRIYNMIRWKLPHVYRLRYLGKDPGEILDTGKFLWFLNRWLKPFNSLG